MGRRPLAQMTEWSQVLQSTGTSNAVAVTPAEVLEALRPGEGSPNCAPPAPGPQPASTRNMISRIPRGS
jgi:hypothetical protein